MPRKPRPQPSRPSINDPGVLEELCRRISQGDGIWKACQSRDMPSDRTVYAHMATDEHVASQISRAREAQQDAKTDRIDKIAEAATPETWQVARLQIWAIQWTAAKLSAKKYGDVKTHRHGGEGGGAIPVRFEALSDGQLSEFIGRLERFVGDRDRESDAGGGEGGTGEEKG